MKKHIKVLAIVAMFVTSIIWGVSFVVMKESLAAFKPAQLISLRFTIASIIVAFLFIKEWKHFNIKVLFQGIIIGAVLFVAYMFQTYGLEHTSPGKNAFLTAVYCVLVPFVAWIINKNKPKTKNLVSAILCLFGIGLISINFNGGNFAPQLGDSLTLICSVFFAFQIVLQNRFSRNQNLFVLSSISFASTGLLSLIFSLIFEGPFTPIKIEMIPSLAFLAFGATALCFMLQNFGLKYSNPNDGAIILSLESVFGTLASFIAGYEDFDIIKYIGFGVVFVAVLISQLDIEKKNNSVEHETVSKKRVIESK